MSLILLMYAKRYAVFALGSTAYPNFCAFGKFVDQTLGELGGKSLMPVCCGDELNGQEQTFRSWLKQISLTLCKELLHMQDDQVADVMGSTENAPIANARFQPVNATEDLVTGKTICLYIK